MPKIAEVGCASTAVAAVDSRYPDTARITARIVVPKARPVVSPAVHIPLNEPPRPGPLVRASWAMTSGSIESGSAWMPA